MTTQAQMIGIQRAVAITNQHEFDGIYHTFARGGKDYSGFTRTYHHYTEGADGTPALQIPDEGTPVKYVALDELGKIADLLTRMWDTTATRDWGNLIARADIKIGDEVLVREVPVTHLIYLEAQFQHLLTVLSAAPVRALGVDWKNTDKVGLSRSPEEITQRPEPRVEYEIAPATDRHQATLLDKRTIQVPAGEWKRINFTGGLPEEVKRALVRSVSDVLLAIKNARIEANSVAVTDISVAQPLLDRVFGAIV